MQVELQAMRATLKPHAPTVEVLGLLSTNNSSAGPDVKVSSHRAAYVCNTICSRLALRTILRACVCPATSQAYRDSCVNPACQTAVARPLASVSPAGRQLPRSRKRPRKRFASMCASRRSRARRPPHALRRAAPHPCSIRITAPGAAKRNKSVGGRCGPVPPACWRCGLPQQR